jgi:hypothetical protein
MKKLLFLLFILVYSISYSSDFTDFLHPVRVTLYTPLMSEKYLPGHIEAEILNVDGLPNSIKINYDFTKSPKKGGDYYYVNYWPSGNKKPEVNPNKKYKGIKTIIIYLNETQLVKFIKNANKIAKEITNNTFGNYKLGYNLIKNNCADALLISLGLNSKPYRSLGITIPGNVYKGITLNFSKY